VENYHVIQKIKPKVKPESEYKEFQHIATFSPKVNAVCMIFLFFFFDFQITPQICSCYAGILSLGFV